MKILQRRGWEKATKAIDARIAQRSGQYTRWVTTLSVFFYDQMALYNVTMYYTTATRTLSSANVEKHLNDCGLSPEFSTHYRMGALSGGQKVKGDISTSIGFGNYFSY